MNCKCHDVLSFKSAIRDIADEAIEFIKAPSFDEMSDIVYAINRFVGSIMRKPYVRVVIGDGRHVEKIQLRMQEYGCIRSKRHLKNNRCPSE